MDDREPPSHLSPEAREWWEDVAGSYVLEPHHFKLLRSACEAWDRAEQAREILADEGLVYQDRFEQPKEHPAVATERQSRDLFRRLVRELGLDSAPADEGRGHGAPANANLRITR